MLLNIAVLPGDGVGPEVTDQAVGVLQTIAAAFGHEIKLTRHDVGGIAVQKCGIPLPEDTLRACLSSDAVLLGAVGGPGFDSLSRQLRPEAGLLRLRRELGAFANLRPAACLPGLEECSPLRQDVVAGTDILIVRELLGGLYFGEPRKTEGSPGQRVATDTMHYREPEVERIVRVAFELARNRRRKVTSVDKANVLECSRLWREVVTHLAGEYSDVHLEHMYVDSAAMAMVSRPADFDVVLAENMFGDILSDEAAAVVGSIGMLPSASLGGRIALYEPVHGSAPDIAGKGIANPIGAILSVAMMLRHSFHLEHEAEQVETAVASALSSAHRTRDLARAGRPAISTSEMGARITTEIRERASVAEHLAAHR
ncbi:MAG: 3-isopropylmalate dehydrogenase [Acidobacteriales bacterium]|nr:3-isopropylmalate dehydrogenase [Terriglobales bacterium]